MSDNILDLLLKDSCGFIRKTVFKDLPKVIENLIPAEIIDFYLFIYLMHPDYTN